MDELLRKLLLDRYVEARRWLRKTGGSVQRAPEGAFERVVVSLPSGRTSSFVATEDGDFEEGVVLAVDELRS